jgi:hypothetical protein
MSGEKRPDSAWLRNFQQSASKLIQEQTEYGYKVQGLIVTESVYDRLTVELGYEPTDIFGYVIEIIDPSEGIKGDVVLIKGHILN